MKKKWIIVLAVVVGIFILGVAKDVIIKISVEKGVNIVTGLKLKMGSLNVGIFKTAVSIKNLKLLNPPNFPDRTMADMPEIYVKYDLPAIIGGKIHLPEVRLGLKEFVVVKNSKGELNLDSLRMVKAQKEGKAPSQTAPGKAPEIKIDSLKLSIGKVIYKDYSRSATPNVKEFDINLNESYTNVDNPYELASLIVVKALMNTSIAGLANFDLQGLKGTTGSVLSTAQQMASSVMSNNAVTQQAAKTAQDTVSNATDVVKDVFKNPFSSGK